MDVGINFFPDVRPEEKAAEVYFRECLDLVELADGLGFHHIRIVEHHCNRYGGYSPNPIVFLAAAAQRSRRLRLITGAVLPVFNHPLKLAGEIGMLDGISGGRLEVGFARAFLPHEFARFGVPLDESRARFDEGLETVRRLLEETDVEVDGRFHRFPPSTTLPRPTQQPRPQFWIAALTTEESFIKAGQRGHHLMAIPLLGAKMRPLLAAYRDAWVAAGHPGQGRVMLAFHMFCDPDRLRAENMARGPINHYLQSIYEAACDWTVGTESKDYPGYDKIIAGLAAEDFDSTAAKGGVWVGSPDDIVEQVESYRAEVGHFEVASLQVNFASLPFEESRRSVELFGREVLPRLNDLDRVAVG
jgi:alkanesulfonate monooxygenase SsuD/methylene tetrahydromethanopterin reductase-like flavin-dependent oxidoreductase (luciferase family)